MPWTKIPETIVEPLVSPPLPSCLFQVFIVESLGRRILLLAGFLLCSASCAILTLALNLQVCTNGSGAPATISGLYRELALEYFEDVSTPWGGGDSMKGLCCISTLKRGRKIYGPACLSAPPRMFPVPAASLWQQGSEPVVLCLKVPLPLNAFQSQCEQCLGCAGDVQTGTTTNPCFNPHRTLSPGCPTSA